MKITCNNCQEVVSKLLCDLPHEWQSQITTAICKILMTTEEDCEKFKECETLTTLSSFSQDGTEVCITYTDENGNEFNRCFDINEVINSSLDDVDPMCIASQEDWDSWTWTERIQAIIDYACNCGE